MYIDNQTNRVALVTGGAGFIGRHVAAELLKKGRRVVVLDDLSGGFEDNLPAGVEFVNGSVTDPALVNALFAQWKFDTVFHLAAYAAENLSHFIKRFNYDNNLMGSVNLINAAVNHGTRCFVFTSSIAVYGDQPSPMHEEMVSLPEDSYGISKWAVERELQICKKLFGLNYLIFRPHNVYGEFQNTGDKYRNVIGIFISQALRGESLTVFGDGEQTRAFTHVDDVAPVIVAASDDSSVYNQTFNIGSKNPYTVNHIAALVNEAFGGTSTITHLPERHEVKNAHSSHAKAEKLLRYHPCVSLDDGLRRMISWVKKAGIRSSKDFSNIEITKNMPLSWVPERRKTLQRTPQ